MERPNIKGEKMTADQDVVIKAVKLISNVLEKNDIPQLEGAIAMKAILNTLAEQGLNLHSEPAQ